MGIGLYTSRVLLNTLGVEDFGVYSVVGGVVALLSFFNSAMSSATQRYLAFDIGSGDLEKLKKTFNTTFVIHVFIAIIVLFFAETIGLWYINNRLNLPQERFVAVNWVYQFSVLTVAIGIMQVPFNALIIAQERMKVFTFLSVIDVFCKFLIAVLLQIVFVDKLILYSFLLFLLALFTISFYKRYCSLQFQESHFSFYGDKKYYKELLVYSSWNLFGNIAGVAKGQGVNLLLNSFGGAVLNAAYGITMQIQGVVGMFVNNFQIAVNPQITKQYSQGNVFKTHQLIIKSAKFSYFLALVVILPILLNTEYLLELWLKTLPAYTVSFVKLCLINILIDCISVPLMAGIQATGKIQSYQTTVGILLFLNLPISYVLLMVGADFDAVFWVSIVISVVSLQFRLYFSYKVLTLSVGKFYKDVIARIILVSVILYGLHFYIDWEVTDFASFLIQAIGLVLFILLLLFVLGINKQERTLLINILSRKILYR